MQKNFQFLSVLHIFFILRKISVRFFLSEINFNFLLILENKTKSKNNSTTDYHVMILIQFAQNFFTDSCVQNSF